MKRICVVLVLAGLLPFLVFPPGARAAMPVIDVASITQLIMQIMTLREQLSTAQNQLGTAESQLDQARDEYRSITGGRGMHQLLAGANRNYLPRDWATLNSYAQGQGVQALVDANAILTQLDLAILSPAQRAEVDALRRSAATLQALGREALATTSQRFQSIQQLINAIPNATDQKAILDLQARIAAEQTMLANDQTKLEVLYQAARAEELARQQRVRERALRDVGSLRDLPAMGL